MGRAKELCGAGLAVVAAMGVGCSLPRGVTGTFDAGAMDAFAHGSDAWAPGNDAYVPPSDDAWSPGDDAYVAPDDAYVPPDDAYVAPDDTGPPGCDAVFMSTSTNYQFCSTDGASCTFYLQIGSGMSCDDVCTRTGHTCVAEIDNNATSHCMSSGGSQACSHNLNDAICTCSWP